MLGCGIAMWQICCRIVVSSSIGGARPLVVLYNMSVAGVRVVEFRTVGLVMVNLLEIA